MSLPDIPRIPNTRARAYVQARKPFKGSNTFAFWQRCVAPAGDHPASGVITLSHVYVVYSYGFHWPLFIYEPGEEQSDDGAWYENAERYSVTTSKHHSQLHPLPPAGQEPLLMSRDNMRTLARYGIAGVFAGHR